MWARGIGFFDTLYSEAEAMAEENAVEDAVMLSYVLSYPYSEMAYANGERKGVTGIQAVAVDKEWKNQKLQPKWRVIIREIMHVFQS